MVAVEHALRSTPALLVACLLLFVEEAGIPTPAPGEVFVIGVGLLVAAGGVRWWIALPACCLAAVAGAMTGFAGSRRLGMRRLRRVARAVGLEPVVDHAADGMSSARPRDVGVSRLVPGLRIMTTLVAGALGLPVRAFLAGMVPAAVVWVAVYMAIGFFVGIPAERFVGNVQALALRLLAILVVLAAGYGIVHRVPVRRGPHPEPHRRPVSGRRRIAAYAIDLVTIAGAVALLDAVTGLELGNLSTPFTTTVVLTCLAVVYVLIARQSRGRTLGERLLHA